nr:hypothetical protein [Streptomyces antimycoticus]
MGASDFDQMMAKNAGRKGELTLGGDVANAKSFHCSTYIQLSIPMRGMINP